MALTTSQAQNLDSRQFFYAALKNYVGEVVFFAVVTLIILGISGYVWWLGIVLFVIVAIIGTVGFIQTVILLPGAYSAWNTVRFLHNHGTHEEIRPVVGDQSPRDQSFEFGTAVIATVKGLIVLAIVAYLGLRLFV